MLSALEKQLVDVAVDMAGSLPEGDINTVAAATMDTYGNVHTGVNVFHFTGGPCAEMAAIAAAAEAGAGPLVTMVAAGDRDRGVISPCGRCRQFMLDLHPDITVIVPSEGDLRAWPVRELLPLAYRAPSYSTGPRIVHFAARYFDAIAAGRKTVTVRRGDPVQSGPTIFVFDDGDRLQRLEGVVDRVRPALVGELTYEDARGEGLPDPHTLRLRLEQHYPDLADDDQVQVAEFRLRR